MGNQLFNPEWVETTSNKEDVAGPDLQPLSEGLVQLEVNSTVEFLEDSSPA